MQLARNLKNDIQPFTCQKEMFHSSIRLADEVLPSRSEAFLDNALDKALQEAMMKNYTSTSTLDPILALALRMSCTSPRIFGDGCYSVNTVNSQRVKFQLDKFTGNDAVEEMGRENERFDIVF